MEAAVAVAPTVAAAGAFVGAPQRGQKRLPAGRSA